MDSKKITKLKIEGLEKKFISKSKEFLAVKDITLDVYDNEFLVILGPGLCGKTVLLNMITGLLEPTAGNIWFNGKQIKGGDLSTGFVFQKLALFPWRRVIDNVAFGLKIKGVPKEERMKIAQHYIDLVGLTGFEKSYPHQLSGGMKQRVGIARAYSNDPELLILDEPFGQLDAQTRYAMQDEVLRMWEQEKKTIIFVTNNIEEALYLGDRIILLDKCPAQVKEIYEINLPRPRNQLSDEFLEMRQKISDNMDLAV